MTLFSKKTKKTSEKSPVCSAVIAAAGSSARMKGEDKLFIEIDGMPVLAHTLKAFQSCELIDEIVVVVRDDQIERVGKLCQSFGIEKATKIMRGGGVRSESVLFGLLAVSKKAKLVAIHDGARPCVDADIIARTIKAAAVSHAAAPAIRVSSTIKRVKDNIVIETVDRENLFEIQTPQVFEANLIKAALTNAVNKKIDVTDDCMALELVGARVHLTMGSRANIKITTSEDITIAGVFLGENKL